MAKRISQLTQLTNTQVAQTDQIPVVDVSAGQTKYITVKDLTGAPDFGWQATGESWSYSSFNSTLNTGVVTVPTDATIKYVVGMWVRISQTTGGTKYAKIVAVTSTTLTLDFPNSVTLANEAITSPVYSPLARPVGVPSDTSFNHTYTNTGSGGGTCYFRNDNGIKIAWGTTGLFNTVAGANYNASFPAGFFSTIQSGSIFNPQSSAVIAQVGSSLTTTAIQQYIQTVSNNVAIAFIGRGV